jgi:hypothetical protein
MTYGCESPQPMFAFRAGAAVSHLAELVRGCCEGPLVRPFGAPRIKSGAGSSPQGEKGFAQLAWEITRTASRTP